MMISNLGDLCTYFHADGVNGLNHRIYKDTECGASISVKTPDGKWHHNGQEWRSITDVIAFSVQTIIEGSDATVDCDPLVLPVDGEKVDAAIRWMEDEARYLWEEANGVETDDDEMAEA